MTERLKQIWSGFEGATTRRLTGAGVDNIALPPRRDYSEANPADLPEAYSAPADAAFSALKTKLESQAHRANKRRKKRGEQTPEMTMGADEQNFADAPRPAKDMLRGLKATEDRVMRATISYTDYSAGQAGAKLGAHKKRRKFLGLF